MNHWKWLVSGLVAAILPALAFAEAGVTDMNTYMYKNFASSSVGCTNFNAQWVNWDDWFDEMNGTAADYSSGTNLSNLSSLLSGSTRNVGLNADLIAVQTHGSYNRKTGILREAFLSDYACNNISIAKIEPLDGEAEIFLFHACDIFSNTDQLGNWFTFRNLHRYGAPVAAGGWETIHLTYTPFTSTFNDMGDEIADQHHTIFDGWAEAHDANGYDDDIYVEGLGTVGAFNCDDRARLVTFQNRLSYDNPSYAHDQRIPQYPGDPELCGYYWNNQ